MKTENTVVNPENFTEDQANLADFLEEENLIVNNIVENDDDIINSNPNSDDGDDPNKNNQNNSNNNQNQNPENKDKPNGDEGNGDDLTDEELLALAKPNDNQQQQKLVVPEKFDSPIEIASYLGINISGKKPEEITFVDVKNELTRVQTLATESELPEIKQMKSYLLENKGATEIDYFQKFVSPLEPLKYMTDKELLMAKFTEVDKKSIEEAESLINDLVLENKFGDEAKAFRNIVNAKNEEFYKKRNQEIIDAQNLKEQQKEKNKADLLIALHTNKSNFMEGKVVLSNKDVKETFDYIASGEVHKALSDHKVMGEIAWFLKNKQTFINILTQEGSNEEKIKHINMLANSKNSATMRGNDNSTKNNASFDIDDWNE